MRITLIPHPFHVPDYVIFETPNGGEMEAGRAVRFPLAKVDPADLSTLCDEFRAGVFKKAGCPDPKAPT